MSDVGTPEDVPAGTMTLVTLDDAPEPVRLLLSQVVDACRDRAAREREVKDAITRREALVVALVREQGLSMRVASELCTEALLAAGFAEAELDSHGVRFGGVRRAVERAG